VKKDRFGKSKGPLSKAEIEREAQRELERLSRGAGGRPAFTPPGGPPTALDNVADSVRGRQAPPTRSMGSPVPDLSAGPSSAATPFGGVPGGRGAPPPSLGPNQPFYDDDEEAADESANVTEIALRDHAARFGSDPEDLVIRQDPFAAEMMRDQAMRQFLDQQQAKEERPRRGPVGDPVTSVLNRLAARKKAEEEALARGDDGSGETVLDRIRARRDAILAEDDPPPPRQLHEEPAHRGRGRGRPRMTMVDDDEESGEDSALAIMRARAEARRPRPPTPSRVYAVPEADEPDELEDELDEDLEGAGTEFADEDETLELADESEEDEDDEELDDEGDPDAPPTPDFAAEVARLSGGRTMGTPRPKKRPGRAGSATRDAARRTPPAAPKRKAKAPARSTVASKARTTRAPITKSRTTSSSAARSAGASAASKRNKATTGAKKAPAARTRPAPAPAPRAPRTKAPVKTKAVPAQANAKAAPAKAKAAPTKAKATPAKARTRAVPAKEKAAPTKAKAAPAKALPASEGNGAVSAAAKKAAAKAKIAAAAERARSRR